MILHTQHLLIVLMVAAPLLGAVPSVKVKNHGSLLNITVSRYKPTNLAWCDKFTIDISTGYFSLAEHDFYCTLSSLDTLTNVLFPSHFYDIHIQTKEKVPQGSTLDVSYKDDEHILSDFVIA